MGDAQHTPGAQHSTPHSHRGCPELWCCSEGLPTPAGLVRAQPAADPGWKQGKKNPAELRISFLKPIQEQTGASPAPGSLALPGLGLEALGMSCRPQPELGSKTRDAGGCRGQRPPRASPGGLFPCSAPLCCGWRGEDEGSEEGSCHLDPGLSISAVAVAAAARC